MGYLTDGLTFNVLREANTHRLPQFRDAQGRIAHSKPDGSDWSPADWFVAVTGELGEMANNMKKVRRGDVTLEAMRPKLEKEMADVLIYFDILAKQYDIDLGRAIIAKFNEVSERVGSNVQIREDGSDWHYTAVDVPPREQCDLCPERAQVKIGGGQLCTEHAETLDGSGPERA